MRRILLVEPGYRNKYPPLGLMKISSYHKLAGDEVHFVKGKKAIYRNQSWDRVYISTLFTFNWAETIRTIKYYLNSVQRSDDVIVGGVMATLLKDDIIAETGVKVIPGLLDQTGVLDSGSAVNIDGLIPDYNMLQATDYKYAVEDAYIAYATRGCPNRCKFCAVHILEPTFGHYFSLQKQVKAIERVYGEKQNLILLDNNVLASSDFSRIINDIRTLGFEHGAILNGKKRYVDFNQGLDARLLSEKKIEQLASTAIKPLRIAFDDIAMKDLYVSRIREAVKHGLLNLSNYVLYNFKDTPVDFYQRLGINCQLNEELGTKIYSFPMKYIPLNSKDRSFIGEFWNRKMIRGVQCILLATHGLVSPRLEFFEAAFGRDEKDFMEIILMPNHYIIQRRFYEKGAAEDWRRLYRSLTSSQRRLLLEIHTEGRVTDNHYCRSKSARFRQTLEHYIEADRLEAEWKWHIKRKLRLSQKVDSPQV